MIYLVLLLFLYNGYLEIPRACYFWILHSRFGIHVKFQQNRYFYCFKTMGTWKFLGIVIFEFYASVLVSLPNFSKIGRYRYFYCSNGFLEFTGLESAIFEFYASVLVSVSNFSVIERYRYFYCFRTIATWNLLILKIFVSKDVVTSSSHQLTNQIRSWAITW